LNKNILYKTISGVTISLILCSCSINKEDEIKTTKVNNVSSNRSKTNINLETDSDYRDGEYQATGEYGSLPSSITVKVTLRDKLITDVEVTPHATNETSLDLQKRFAKAVPKVVIGKSIDEVNVGRLAGSSGTPDGFNNAIEQIKEQAIDTPHKTE